MANPKASIGLVGDSSAGKSVALSLLYLTARDKSIDDPDKFILDFDPATAQVFRDIAGPMEKGRFPGATQKGQLSRVSLNLKYSKIPKVKLPKGLIAKQSPTSKLVWKNISMKINDIAGEEIKETLIAVKDAQTPAEMLEKIGNNDQVKELLSNQAFIVILDGEKLSNADSTVDLDYDTLTLLSAMSNYREKVTKKSFNGLCFLITKWDLFAKLIAEDIEDTNIKNLIRTQIPNTMSYLNSLEKNSIMQTNSVPWLASRISVKTDDNGKTLQTPVLDTNGNALTTPDGEEITAPEIRKPLRENYSTETYDYILGWIEAMESSFFDFLK